MLERVTRDSLEVWYDTDVFARDGRIGEFLASETLDRLVWRGEAMIVALGGDGTMLRVIRQNVGRGMPFLGVNFGHKGFLLSEPSDVDGLGEWERLAYPLLSSRLSFGGGEIEYESLNETVARVTGPSVQDFRVELSDLSLDLRADGLMVSTPAGSTAYGRSAGGPVLPHSAPFFILTPLAPFEPMGQGSVIFGDAEPCRVSWRAHPYCRISFFSDATPVSEHIESEFSLEIRKSSRSIELLVPARAARRWREKIYREQGFR